MSPESIDVFPLDAGAFGVRGDWLARFSTRMSHPAYMIMTLLIVVAVGVMTLKRFENADLEKKLWNIPILATAIAFWPYVVLGLKGIVDEFNAFLVVDIFRIPWRDFGYPYTESNGMIGWSVEALARLVPNLAYWVIYAFYIVSFFFYAVLGPLILAKGILSDEVESFLELVKEIVLLLMWQTTVVILVSFIMPDIVSGRPFPPHPQSNFYFLSLVLGIMIFFVPALTRKFASHLGSSFIPLGFRYGGAAVGLSAVGGFAGAALGAGGFPLQEGGLLSSVKEQVSKGEEFKARYGHKKHMQDLESDHEKLEEKLHSDHEREEESRHEGQHEVEEGSHSHNDLIELDRKAKREESGEDNE